MSLWVTEELESTESTQVVEVKPVVCTTREFWWINCKYHYLLLKSVSHQNYFHFFSHPGFYGKCGMRVFHKQRNWAFCPTINIDKLWSLVSEETKNAALKSKDKVPVIDVTKSVSKLSRIGECTPFPIYYFKYLLLNNKRAYSFYKQQKKLIKLILFTIGIFQGSW